MHRLHDELVDVFLHFLACFIKPEVNDLTARQLKSLELSNENILLPSSSIFTGNATENVLKEMRNKPTTKKESESSVC